MSLATDLLKRAERMPARVSKPTFGTKPAKKVKRKQIHRQHEKPDVEHIRGITFSKQSGGWGVYTYDGDKVRCLGKFKDRDRAVLTQRLYKLWRKRGFTEIPHKPTQRTYNNW